jgi:hypothetical protein
MKCILATISIAILLSCNSNDSKTISSTTDAPKQQSAIECYRFTSTNDTVSLQLTRSGEYVTGSLVYNLKEKDKNRGNLQGSLKGNLLIADYTFESEGTKSIREVVFKKDGDGFVEGYGDVETKDNRVQFKNIDSLQFRNTIKLDKVDCRE